MKLRNGLDVLTVVSAVVVFVGCDDVMRPDPIHSPLFATASDVVVTHLGDLGGGGNVYMSDINRAGHIVGSSLNRNGELRAFVWSYGVMTDLGTIGGDNTSRAKAINDVGQILGESYHYECDGDDCTSTSWHPVIWEDGRIRNLGSLPTGERWVPRNRLNILGQAIGYAGGGSQAVFYDGVTVGRLEAESGLCYANDLNDLGQVVGWCWIDPENPAYPEYRSRTVIWDLGTGETTVVGSADWAYVEGARINNLGQVIGRVRNLGYPTPMHGFFWDPDAGMTVIEELMEAWELNDLGQVVGRTGGFWQGQEAVLWEGGLVTYLGIDSPHLLDINNFGQVIGMTAFSESYFWELGELLHLGTSISLARAGRSRLNDRGQFFGWSYDAATTPNWRAARWSVGVTDPDLGDHIGAVVAGVDALAEQGAISDGQADGMRQQIATIATMLQNENVNGAVALLGAFVKQVEAMVRRGVLTAAEAEAIIEAAQQAAATLGG